MRETRGKMSMYKVYQRHYNLSTINANKNTSKEPYPSHNSFSLAFFPFNSLSDKISSLPVFGRSPTAFWPPHA